METWRRVFREGVAPVLSTKGLAALRLALLRDDSRLTQGCTTTPPAMPWVQDWPCEGACLLGFAGWQGDGLKSVGDVERYFVKVCYDANQRLGEPATVRQLLNHFDVRPRDEMRRELLPEVNRALAERETTVAKEATNGRERTVAEGGRCGPADGV
jgi:hypothetical protein